MPLEPEPDLPWTAFLYVNGDLTPDQASSFERRLDDDQEAREAVAEAVELAGALALVGPEFAPRRRSTARRALLGAASMAAAAGLLLAISSSFRPIEPVPPDASRVAQAWSGLRAEVDADWTTFAAEAHATSRAEPGQVAKPDELDEAESGLSTERALPSWLLSAASAPVDGAPAPLEE